MASRLKPASPAGLILLVVVTFCSTGCNRAAIRIPGASLRFPETPTGYKAKASYPYTIIVAKPIDQRVQHYGERVADTQWTGCSTDALWNTDAAQLIQQRLVTELESSGLFLKVSSASANPDDLVLRTEIRAFCSQAIGFFIIRVAGITALRVTLEQSGKILFDHEFEKVVTDADKEYSGSQVTFIEQAMKVTMADSLREMMKDMLKSFETEAAIGTGTEVPQAAESKDLLGDDYVRVPGTDERLSPSEEGQIVNRLYLQQKVTVYQITGKWARVTDFRYKPGWVIYEHLSRTRPEHPRAQPIPQELRDPRIEKDALPKVGESELTQEDINILWKGANLMLKQGRCTHIVYGDKSTTRPNTYFVSDGPRNYYFTATDVK